MPDSRTAPAAVTVAGASVVTSAPCASRTATFSVAPRFGASPAISASTSMAPEMFDDTRTASRYNSGRMSIQTGCHKPPFWMYQFCLPRGSSS